MKKTIYTVVFLLVGTACFITGFSLGLDQKETIKQSFRTALLLAKNDFKALNLQQINTVTSQSELQQLLQYSLEQNVNAMVLNHESGIEINQSDLTAAKDFLQQLDTAEKNGELSLFSDKEQWPSDEVVVFIKAGTVKLKSPNETE